MFYDMKKSRFGDSQVMDVLKRAEASIAVPDLCREMAERAVPESGVSIRMA